MKAFEVLGDPYQEVMSRLSQYGVDVNPITLKIENPSPVLKDEINRYHTSLKTRDMAKVIPAMENLTSVLSDPSVQGELAKEKYKDQVRSNNEFLKLTTKADQSVYTKVIPQLSIQSPWQTRRPSVDDLIHRRGPQNPKK